MTENNVNEQVLSTPESTSPAQSEKLIPQSEVSKLIASYKEKSYEKGFEKGKQETLSSQPQQPSKSVMPDEIESIIAKQVDERLAKQKEQDEKQRQDHAAAELNKNFEQLLVSNALKGQEKYKDWKESTTLYADGLYMSTLALVNSEDNATDLMYKLAKNPERLRQIETMARTEPRMAYQAIREISMQLKNEDKEKQSLQAKQPAQPISELASSYHGNGQEMSVSELRRIGSTRRC